MASKSIKLDIIPAKQNQFKLAHINSAIQSYFYPVKENTGEGKLVFILSVEDGLQITELPDKINQQVTPPLKVKKDSKRSEPRQLPEIKHSTTFPAPENLSSYFEYKENTCRCRPNIATELLFKFTIPENKTKIYSETQNDTQSYFLKIGDNIGEANEHSIKLVLRNLEQKEVYTIRHINLQVESYCIPYSKISIGGKGQIVISLDIQHGFEITNAKQADDLTAPNIDDGTNMCLAYNDNMIKYNNNKEKPELEFTLKLLIYYNNILYIKNTKKFLQTQTNNTSVNLKENSFLGNTSFAATNDSLGNKLPGGNSSGESIDYFNMLFSNSPSSSGVDDGTKAPGSTGSGATIDYFGDTMSDDPSSPGNKLPGQPPSSGLLIGESF